MRKGCEKGAIVFAAAMSTSSSGDEDVPSPAAAVLARRASRKVRYPSTGGLCGCLPPLAV